MAKKRRKTEAQLDLANIRKLKRLTRRVYSGLEAMERWLMKMERGSNKYQDQPTPDEVEAALDAYGVGCCKGCLRTVALEEPGYCAACLDEFNRQPGDGPTQKSNKRGHTIDSGVIR